VPVPGGTQNTGGTHCLSGRPAVTSPQAFRATAEAFKSAFLQNGAEKVWENVVGVVVQPGVEFGDGEIFVYEAEAAETAALCAELKNHPGIVFEGHSTDYQPRRALREMVRDGVCILKVGPALTFYQREALFALSNIETELFEGGFLPCALSPSLFPQTLEEAMLAAPANWQNYYSGNAGVQRYKRKYSYSDRSRYYMNAPPVAESVKRLFANLSAAPIPLALLSQYMPGQAVKVRDGEILNDPQSLVLSRITDVIEDYVFALN
jgi:D-tagatose-1,6-bisphosphate aldolase subunit GatZ/KbaZ